MALLFVVGLLPVLSALPVIPPPHFDTPQAVEEPSSNIEVTLATPLDAIRAAAENAVPMEENRSGAWTMFDDDAWGLKWYVRRSPIALISNYGRLRLETTLVYNAAACRRIKKPFPLSGYICPQVASCSAATKVWLDMAPSATADWKVDAHAVTGASPLSPCQVTALNIDVTDRITTFLKQKLSEAVGNVERELSNKLRGSAEQSWRALQQPTDLSNGLWLAVRPTRTRAAALSIRDGQLTTSFGIIARVHILGQRPEAAPVPLPNLEAAPPEGGFRVLLDSELDYDAATHLVAPKLRGKRYTMGDNEFVIDEVSIRGSGGKMVMRVDFSGTESGTLFLTGTPQYDPATETLRCDALDFSVETESVLLEAAAWVKRDELLGSLREQASWKLPSRRDVMSRLTEALNRDLGAKTKMSTRLGDARLLGVDTTALGFKARALVEGQCSVMFSP